MLEDCYGCNRGVLKRHGIVRPSAGVGVKLARMGPRRPENAMLPDLTPGARAEHRGGRERARRTRGMNLAVQFLDNKPRKALARVRNGVRRAVRNAAEALCRIGPAPQARELVECGLDMEPRRLQPGLPSAFRLAPPGVDELVLEPREPDEEAHYRGSSTGLDRAPGTVLDRRRTGIKQVGR